MKIIILAKGGESQLDLVVAVRAAYAAIESGIADQKPGYAMGVRIGEDGFGIVRRKSAITVYLPDREEDEK